MTRTLQRDDRVKYNRRTYTVAALTEGGERVWLIAYLNHGLVHAERTMPNGDLILAPIAECELRP